MITLLTLKSEQGTQWFGSNMSVLKYAKVLILMLYKKKCITSLKCQGFAELQRKHMYNSLKSLSARKFSRILDII